MTGWIVNKENILEYCQAHFKFHSWNSVRYWRQQYSFPVRYLPNGVPFIIESEVIIWSIKYDELKRNKIKFSPPL